MMRTRMVRFFVAALCLQTMVQGSHQSDRTSSSSSHLTSSKTPMSELSSQTAFDYFVDEAKKICGNFTLLNNLSDFDIKEAIKEIEETYNDLNSGPSEECTPQDFWEIQDADCAFISVVPITRCEKKNIIKRLLTKKSKSEFIISQYLEAVDESPVYCPVCYENKDGVTLQCGHDVCKNCLGMLFRQTEVVVGSPTKIFCPMGDAHIIDGSKQFSEIELEWAIKKQIVESKILEELTAKITNIKLIEKIAEDQNKTRYCPSCKYKNVNEERLPKVTCAACDKIFCFLCRVQHGGQTCQEYQRSVYGDGTADGMKHCPKCWNSVFKSAGCIHMTCNHEIYDPDNKTQVIGKCSYSWCWICNGHFGSKGHSGEHGFGICDKLQKAEG